jgi:ketosteroid isomerase-like protein
VDRVSVEEHLAAVDVQLRWAEAVDQRDWAQVRAAFTDDATSELPASGGHADPDSMVAAIRTIIERLEVTQHHLSNHIVERDGDLLIARCYVLAQHVRVRHGTSVTFTFGGRYTDRLRRDGGRLKIAHRTLEVAWRVGDPSVLDAG